MKSPIMSFLRQGPNHVVPRRRKGSAGLVATVVTLAVLSSAVVASPASAATLSEQRSALRQITYVAAQDYVNARPYVPQLARRNALTVKDAIASGTASLKAAGDALSVATTQAAMDAVAVRIRNEATRAATVRKSALQLTVLVDYRTAQQSVATKALADYSAARISLSTYGGAKERTSAFTTQLAADTAAQLAVIGQPVPAPNLKSTALARDPAKCRRTHTDRVWLGRISGRVRAALGRQRLYPGSAADRPWRRYLQPAAGHCQDTAGCRRRAHVRARPDAAVRRHGGDANLVPAGTAGRLCAPGRAPGLRLAVGLQHHGTERPYFRR